MLFKGLLTGLCLVGVPTTSILLPGDLKGLLLSTIPISQELLATGLSAAESTRILHEGGVFGVPGVREVLGVLGVLFPKKALSSFLGDFVGVLFGL